MNSEIIDELYNRGKISGFDRIALMGDPKFVEMWRAEHFRDWDKAERSVMNKIALIESLKAGVE
jgi:hypothetical protein